MTKLIWTTKRIKLGDLQEWDKNPVQISERDAKELAKSLDKFEHVLPYVAAAPLNGHKSLPLLDGHQRRMVELALNKVSPNTMVDVRVPSRKLTEKEREELVIRLRKNVGIFDFDKLANFFETEDLLDWGFTERELQLGGFDLPNETMDAEPQIEPDRFEAIAKKWKTKDRQLWKAGNHFIYCGDSLNKKSIEIVLQGIEPSLVIADPPYGINIVAANGFVGGGENARGMIPFGGIKNKRVRGSDRASNPFRGRKAIRGTVGTTNIVEVGKYPVVIGDENTDTAKKAFALCLERFDASYHVWWGANYYSEVLKPSQCWLVWNKETTGNFADCELAWTNAEQSAKLFTHRWNGMLRDSERERRWHPTQKPAALAAWVFGLFTKEGETIFDPFGGAGWSLLGAERTGRSARIIEKSHEYVAVMLERFSVAFPSLSIERVTNDKK